MTTTQINGDGNKITFEARMQADPEEEYLKFLYTTKKDTDVELRMGSEVISAHKRVLSYRSPVFSAMFNHDMVEKQTNSINITDINAETMDLLLRFMYLGSIDVLNYETALQLFLVAEKYQVLALKDMCSSILPRFISVSNVSEILSAADMVGDQRLKLLSMAYIAGNSYEILFTDSWKELVKSNVKLLSETLKFISDVYPKKQIHIEVIHIDN